MQEIFESIIYSANIKLGIFVASFAIIKIIMVKELRKFKRAISSIFVGFPTGWLAGNVAIELGFGEYTAVAFGVTAALASENIILFILSVDFKDVVFSFFKKLIEKWT